jgi:hypothetical protein
MINTHNTSLGHGWKVMSVVERYHGVKQCGGGLGGSAYPQSGKAVDKKMSTLIRYACKMKTFYEERSTKVVPLLSGVML